MADDGELVIQPTLAGPLKKDEKALHRQPRQASLQPGASCEFDLIASDVDFRQDSPKEPV